MQDLEAKRLRESLVEYENYLNEIRQVTRKNVEALDVIQKYTDQSAAGMQNLAEQSIEGNPACDDGERRRTAQNHRNRHEQFKPDGRGKPGQHQPHRAGMYG